MKKATRKRPTITLTVTPSHKLLLDTLSIQSGRTRSSILESLLDYIAAEFKEHPDKVMESIETP